MKIGFFIENYRQGGLDKIFIEKINNWPKSSDELYVFCNSDHQGIEYLKKNIPSKCNFITYKSPYFFIGNIKSKLINFVFRVLYNTIFCYIRMVTEIYSFKKKVSLNKIDILYIHNGGWPGGRVTRSVAIAGKLAGIHQVFYVIHNLAYRKNILIYFQEAFLESVLKLFKIEVISVSDAVKRTLAKYTFLPKAITILNGISEPKIKISNKQDFLKKLKIDQDHFIISTIGTFEMRRGHFILFKALKKIIKDIPNIKLLLVGTGNDDEKFRINKLIRKYELDSYINILGHRSDVADIINVSSLVVNPVIAFESFGLVALESMSLNTTILSSNVGGVSEVITHGETGLLCKAGAVDDLVKNILFIKNNQERSKELSNLGLKRYHKYFTASRMAKEYFALLKKNINNINDHVQ